MGLRIESGGVWSRLRSGLGQVDAASRRTLNRAAVTLSRRWPAQAKRDISKQYALKPKKISSALIARVSGGSVSLTAVGRPQPLTYFPTKWNPGARGVTVQLEKGASILIEHAFIRVPKGAPQAGPQAFMRVAALGGMPDGVNVTIVANQTKHGYPLALLRGPTVASMLANGQREDRLFDFAGHVLVDEFDRLNLVEVLRG
jgi:hypothetical protein